MAQKTDIRLRRSDTAGKIPTSANLSNGEMAINTNSGALYFKKSDNTVITVHDNTILHIDSDITGSNTTGSSPKVGIGTTSPSASLTVAGGIPNAPTGDGVHLGLTSNYAQMQLNGSAGGIIDFSTSGVDSIGRILYDQTSDYMRFDTNYSERMRIDSSGNLQLASFGQQLKFGSSSNALGYSSWTMSASAGGVIKNVVGSLTLNPDNFTAFQINDVEVARIEANGRLGIGTSSPSQPLHVYKASGNTETRIETGAGASYLRLKSNTQTNAAYNGIYSDYGSTNDWFITGGNSAGDTIRFGTANTERMRIDSSGNLLVGKTASNIATDGIELGTRVESTADGTYPLRLNRRSSDGDIINFRKDNSTVGIIQARGGDLVIGTGDTGIRFNDSDNAVMPHHATDVVNNQIDIGHSSYKFKDLHLSGNANVGEINITADNPEINFIDTGNTNTSRIRNVDGRLQYDADLNNEFGGSHHIWKADGSDLMFLNSTGLGIGTNSPSEKLHVVGGALLGSTTHASDSRVTINGSVGGISNALTVKNSSASISGRGTRINLASSNTEIGRIEAKTVTDSTSGSLSLSTASSGSMSTAMFIDSSQRVGIGTSSPNEKLTVDGNTFLSGDNRHVYFGGGNTFIGERSNTTHLQLRGGGNSAAQTVYIDNNGYLGLGTASPDAKVTAYNADTGITGLFKLWTNTSNNTGADGGAIEWVGSGDSTAIGAKISATRVEGGGKMDMRFYTGRDSDSDHEKMRILVNGNVGIGTTSPSVPLSVVGDIQTSTKLITKTTNGEVLRFERASDSLRYNSITSNSLDGGEAFISFKVHDGVSATSQADVLHLKGDGKVGIGTTSPSAQLHVKSSGNGEIEVERTSGALINLQAQSAAGYVGTDSNHLFGLKANGTVQLKISTAGVITFNDAYSFPTTIGSAGQILKVPTSGTSLIWGNASGGGGGSSIEDNDGDTKIQVEETADEDIIRFDIAGTQKMFLSSTQLGVTGDLAVSGNLNITGDINSTSVTNLDVTDKTITMANNAGSSANADGAGIIIEGPINNASLLWDHANQYLEFNKEVFSPAGFVIGTAGTKVGRMYNSSGVMALEAYAGRQISFGNATNGEHVRINADGNVGIGTTSPNAKLESYVSGNFSTTHNNFSGDGLYIQTNGTVADGEYTAGISFSRTAANSSRVAGIAAVQEGADADKNGLAFFTHPSTGTTDALQESLRISADGSVGIGTATPALQSGGTGIHVNGPSYSEIKFTNSTTGTASTDGTALVTVGTNFTINNRENGYFSLNTNNSERLRVTSGGNVGIGTTSPTRQLTVKNSNHAIMALTAGTSSLAYYTLGDDDDDNVAQIILDNSTNKLQIQNGGGSTIANRGITLDSSENVGIGTSSPSANLEITQSGNNVGLLVAGGGYNYTAKFESVDAEANIIIEDSNSTNDGNMIGVATNDMYFITNTAERMRIDSSGDVGIGTSSPTERLTVLGNQNITGKLAVGASAAHGSFDFYNQNTAYFNGAVTIDDNLYVTTGSVGIGTSSPANTLHVNSGSDNNVARFESTDGGAIITLKDNTGAAAVANIGDNLYFKTSSSQTDRMTILSNGKVGIGTSSPANLLSVESTGQFAGINIKSASSNGISYLDFGDADDNNIGGINYDNSTDTLQLRNGNTHHVFLKSDGKVGIGTGSPSKPLHVQFSGDNGVRIESEDSHSSLYIDSHTGYGQYIRFTENNTNRYWINGDTSGRLLFRPGASGIEASLITFDSSGQVGIGKTTVNAKLQVEELGIDTTTTSTSATTQVTLASLNITKFRSARFTIQVTNTTDSTYHTSEILAVHDGTTAYITEFGEIHTGSSVEATFDAAITSGFFRLQATPTSTDDMVFKVVSYAITV